MKKKKGYTLIEILIYIALSGGVLMAGVKFLWDFVALEIKDSNRQELISNQSFALLRFNDLVSQADKIETVSSSQLDLIINGDQKSLRMNDGLEELGTDGNWHRLISSDYDQVGEFVDESDQDGDNDKIVNLRLTTSRGDESLDWRLSGSLGGQFNQGREVLVDVSRVILEGSNNQELNDLFALNVGGETVRLIGIKGEWVINNRLRSVAVNGSNVWSGTANSGEWISFSSQSLGVNQEMKLGLSFDNSLDGQELKLWLKYDDQSVSLAKLIPVGSGGGTVEDCDSYCQSLGYKGGICRNNSWACFWNGETHEEGGDKYCTGGSKYDTCCCGNEEVKTCAEVCQDLGYDDGTCRRNARACRRNNETHERDGDPYCTGGPREDTCCCKDNGWWGGLW